MLVLLLLGFLVLVPRGTEAQTNTLVIDVDGPVLTVTVTANQETKLHKQNDRNNAATGQTLTVNQYVGELLKSIFKEKEEESARADQVDACHNYHATITPAQRQQIDTTLGGYSPCP